MHCTKATTEKGPAYPPLGLVSAFTGAMMLVGLLGSACNKIDTESDRQSRPRDRDLDMVPDVSDACPDRYGEDGMGCPKKRRLKGLITFTNPPKKPATPRQTP